jgi:hypothetical protein
MAQFHSAFGDVEFNILWDGDLANMPGWEQESFASTVHIPGSNRNVTFLLGNGPYTRTFEVLCDTQSHYTNLKLMRHTEAILRVPAAMNDLDDTGVEEINYFGSAYAEISDVLLVGLSAARVWVDGQRSAFATFQRDEVAEADVA